MNINRQTTTPFYLRLFYSINSYHSLSNFNISSEPLYSTPATGANATPITTPRLPVPAPVPAPALPAHIETYAWMSTTLRELSGVLVSSLPLILPNTLVGTRLCFRIVYPDTSGVRSQYLGRDLGDVVISDTALQPKDDHGRGESCV